MDKYNVNNTKLRIYESYDAGYITESEKNQYLEVIESFIDSKKDYKRYSSSILDPTKLFKTGDNKCYIDCSNFKDIDNREDIQRTIVKIKPVAIASMIKHAKDLYPNWYEDVDAMKFSEVKSLMMELFDVIHVSDEGTEIYVEYWINGWSSHKKSMDFFGDHCLNVIYTINKQNPSKYKEKYHPRLEG